MDGLGISFASSSASESSESTPSSPSPSPPHQSPLPDLPHGFASRGRSDTRTSSDSFMESKLSEFENWKKSVLEETPQDSPSKRALRKELLEKDDLARNNWSRRPFLREKARQLIAKEAGAMAPSLDEHPAFCNQRVRLREKNHSTKTDVPKCWRPGKSRDEELRGCCERSDVICEDCGFVLCADCGSRCRGEDWCVVEGCVRCQTRLGVNICTPHLRELRAIPVSSFHGHLVEQSALDLIENL